MALLLHCAGGREFHVGVVRPEAVQTFAEGHADVVLDTNPNGSGHCHNASVSWRDGSPKRCSNESCGILGKFGRLPFHARRMGDPMAPPTLVAAQTVAGQVVGVEGFDPPSWEALADASVHHAVTQMTLAARSFFNSGTPAQRISLFARLTDK